MSNVVTEEKLIAEADLSDGLLLVAEDRIIKGTFHVWKHDRYIQPNHDAKGVMRYLMTVIHALGYKADKIQKQLDEEKEKTKALEEKIALLERTSDSQ